jgi:hypothetical protein
MAGGKGAAGGEGRRGRRWLSTGKKLRPAELDRELAVDDVLRQHPHIGSSDAIW